MVSFQGSDGVGQAVDVGAKPLRGCDHDCESPAAHPFDASEDLSVTHSLVAHKAKTG
jgi:hypothetical protein